jgi:hypothetical protein
MPDETKESPVASTTGALACYDSLGVNIARTMTDTARHGLTHIRTKP